MLLKYKNNKMKKSIIAVTIASSLMLFPQISNSQTSHGYSIRIPTSEKLSHWSIVSPTFGSWFNYGPQHSCNIWSPYASTVPYGESFTQSRTCKQDQKRNVYIREQDSFSGEIKVIDTKEEMRTILLSESKTNTGTFGGSDESDWVEYNSLYTSWNTINGSYSAWLPELNNQKYNFTQYREFSGIQERFEQKREINLKTSEIRYAGERISHVRTVEFPENRSIKVAAVSAKEVSAHSHTEWTPDEATICEGAVFTQERSYVSVEEITYRMSTLSNETLKEFNEHIEYSRKEFREKGGLKKCEDNGLVPSTFTDWETYDESHGEWMPLATNQTSNFNQSREKILKQERFEQKREYNYSTGEYQNVGEPIRHTQEITGISEARTVLVSTTGWKTEDTHSFSQWSPDPATVCQGSAFIQVQNYIERQSNTYRFSIGGEHHKIREIESQNTRESAGTKDCGSWAPHTSLYGVWTDTYATYGIFSPSATNQRESFTQTRPVEQNQERIVKLREINLSTGEIRISGEEKENRVVNKLQSRTVYVNSSEWMHYSNHSYGPWTPSSSEVCYGQNFYQERNYVEKMTMRFSFSIGGYHSIYEDFPRTQAKLTQGTKECNQ